MTDNIFQALQVEIERVTRKHERWQGYAKDMPEMASGMALGATLMKAEIDTANSALASMDPVQIAAALKSLREYDDND